MREVPKVAEGERYKHVPFPNSRNRYGPGRVVRHGGIFVWVKPDGREDEIPLYPEEIEAEGSK